MHVNRDLAFMGVVSQGSLPSSYIHLKSAFAGKIGRDTLQKKPDDRPTAAELLKYTAVNRHVSSDMVKAASGMDEFEKVEAFVLLRC